MTFASSPGRMWQLPDGPRPMIYLVWVDSSGMNGWADPTEYEGLRPHVVHTAGILLADTPTHVTVVQSCADPDGGTGDPQYDHAIAIPTCAITRRVDVPTEGTNP